MNYTYWVVLVFWGVCVICLSKHSSNFLHEATQKKKFFTLYGHSVRGFRDEISHSWGLCTKYASIFKKKRAVLLKQPVFAVFNFVLLPQFIY